MPLSHALFEQICTPLHLDWSCREDIDDIACGRMHTLMLTVAGKVYSCGCNDHGQLGQTISRKRPRMCHFSMYWLGVFAHAPTSIYAHWHFAPPPAEFVLGLENYRIQQVVAGSAHSVALNEWGQCFTWGSNSRGQLGCNTAAGHESMCTTPKLVKPLATRHVVQIASGLYHTLALTQAGELYAWGSNAYGQLGIGEFGDPVCQPTLVRSLHGIPLAFVACGGNHSFAVSK